MTDSKDEPQTLTVEKLAEAKRSMSDPLVKRDIIVNGNQIVFPRRSISYEEVAELAGHTGGRPTITYRIRSSNSIGNGDMQPGDVILLPYEIAIFNAVYTGNA